MKRKRHTSEQIVEQLRKADEPLASEKNNEEAAKSFSVTVTTLYRWKRQFGDMENQFQRISEEHPRFGYRRATATLCREEHRVNDK